MEKTPRPERRVSPRWIHRFRVHFDDLESGSLCLGFSENLSLNGMFVGSLMPAEKGEKIEFVVELPDALVSLAGIVVWSRFIDPDQSGLDDAGFGVSVVRSGSGWKDFFDKKLGGAARRE